MIVLIFITISIFIAAADFDIIRQHHSVVINITTNIFSMTPLSPSLKFIIIITILIIITIHHAYHHHPDQGGRTWQSFVGSKNGNENIRQARIYNFRVKCVVFARNRKFAKLTQ